ncbi:syntaphilin [Engraulis encrasicolus]|uniref:syntaphilin n=1 Tax=Engraulis encrasicolus TaxID=184585 RepID=UPI002FCEA1BD
MSLQPANRRTPTGSRRRCAAPGGSSRHSHADSSLSSYSCSSSKTSECIQTSRSQPVTPRRQVKHSTCSDNHGIRPPAPEQYLTPLQQKEVCIRHLRARLRENVERLQDRDVEIDELRGQLVRMQEDWIEEECHRVEAQMALKEARKEIRQLQHVVETVRTNLGTREPGESVHGEPKSEGWFTTPGGRVLVARPGLSRSCGCSPAHTISRSATYTRLSTDASPTTSVATDRNGNVDGTAGVGFGAGAVKSKTLPRGEGRTHLLLEAALLADHHRCPSMPRSSTYERLCSGETLLPVPVPHPHPHPHHHPSCCHALNNNCSCGTPHSYMPHHHLFLHLPQEDAPLPPPPIPPPPVPAPSSVPSDSSEVSDRPGYRSQACSPTITWISEEDGGCTTGDELSMITTASTAPITSSNAPAPPHHQLNPATALTTISNSATSAAVDTSILSEATAFLSLGSSPTVSSGTPQATFVDLADVSPLDGSSSLEFPPPLPPQPHPPVSLAPSGGVSPQTQQPQRLTPTPTSAAMTPILTPTPTPSLSPLIPPLTPMTPSSPLVPTTATPTPSPSPMVEPLPPSVPPSPREVHVLEVSEEDDDVRSPLSGTRRDGEEEEEDEEEDEAGNEPPQRCHWSRYFLVDLLAVAVPVVPAVAWLCRGARRPDLPVYPIGSLLRGCCAVALHSLRRVGRGRGRGRGPANAGGATNI